MAKTIYIDPVTRVSGFLEIGVEVEDNTVINAKTSGLLYRGFEKMLKGRAPLDAIYFTERICGICSCSHSVAASKALEQALKIKPDINDIYIRDLMHGFEFMQNHLRQFYFFTVPDYVKLPELNPISPQRYSDYRLSDAQNKKISSNFAVNVEFSRLAHEGLATLGGKAPHNHGIFAGGVTVNMDSYKISKVKSIISRLKGFINNFMLEDMNTISTAYQDYFEKGKTYGNYISYGVFNDYSDPDILFLKPGVMINGERFHLDINKITENIMYSWYSGGQQTDRPGVGNETEADISKQEAYSFIKAPRYEGLAFEGGPIARLMLTGEYNKGNSCMDRNAARVLETKKIIGIMEKLCERIELKNSGVRNYDIPADSLGAGLSDTIRGALGHWIRIKGRIIDNYDIITPSGWNFSPMDDKGIHGAAEKALIGTRISNLNEPIELGRIVRSFDPCISCATHIIGNGKTPIEIVVM